jgi:cell division protein ZapA (FtsZ GTPase activity inhibitor)
MAEKKTNTITINGTDYTEDQLTESQKVMVNHVADLDRKIGSANFNLDQLKMGRMAFMQSLNASLEVKEAAE